MRVYALARGGIFILYMHSYNTVSRVRGVAFCLGILYISGQSKLHPSVLIKMSAIFVSIGMMVLVSRMDFLSLLFVGGSGAGAKKAA